MTLVQRGCGAAQWDALEGEDVAVEFTARVERMREGVYECIDERDGVMCEAMQERP